MARFYNRLMLGFVAVFIAAVAVAFGYQFLYVIPAQKCEAVGSWWEPSSRICATPIYLPHITGRPVDRAARAQAAQAGLPEAERRSPKVVVDPRPAF
ncbi:MAG TPA: hypothetical protein VL358_05065 [Caulobacteraceae bacterium]|jgi:hypothetical protein|nr:hypothetical protein [Caulobacteraceae bacterium]